MNIPLIAIWVGLVGMYFSVYAMYRNNRVLEYRMRIINKIFQKGTEDIENGQPVPRWRMEEFDKVSYNEMVYKFWRKIDSFYEGNACLNDVKPPELSDSTIEDIL